MAVTYENSCQGKAQCADRAEARRMRKRIRGVHGGAGTLHIYRCPFCAYFHVGHMPVAVARGEYDKDAWRNKP